MNVKIVIILCIGYSYADTIINSHHVILANNGLKLHHKSRYSHKRTCYSDIECKANLKCVANRCLCQIGFGYQHTTKSCEPFATFLCTKQVDCRDIDQNRICLNNRCECSGNIAARVTNLCIDNAMAFGILNGTEDRDDKDDFTDIIYADVKLSTIIWFSFAIPGLALLIFLIVWSFKYFFKNKPRSRRVSSNNFHHSLRHNHLPASVISTAFDEQVARTDHRPPNNSPQIYTIEFNNNNRLNMHNYYTNSPYITITSLPPAYDKLEDVFPPSYDSLQKD